MKYRKTKKMGVERRKGSTGDEEGRNIEMSNARLLGPQNLYNFCHNWPCGCTSTTHNKWQNLYKFLYS